MVCAGSFSQSNTVATGGNATGSNGSVSYSVGQIDYTSQSGSGGNINQGVQQPYEIFESNSLNELGENILLNLGPNPTTDLFTLSNVSSSTIELFYYLIDNNGKIVIESTQLLNKAEISMSTFPVGMYQLVVRNSNMDVKSFKIIKN
jgi:hypothetical protein